MLLLFRFGFFGCNIRSCSHAPSTHLHAQLLSSTTHIRLTPTSHSLVICVGRPRPRSLAPRTQTSRARTRAHAAQVCEGTGKVKRLCVHVWRVMSVRRCVLVFERTKECVHTSSYASTSPRSHLSHTHTHTHARAHHCTGHPSLGSRGFTVSKKSSYFRSMGLPSLLCDTKNIVNKLIYAFFIMSYCIHIMYNCFQV